MEARQPDAETAQRIRAAKALRSAWLALGRDDAEFLIRSWSHGGNSSAKPSPAIEHRFRAGDKKLTE